VKGNGCLVEQREGWKMAFVEPYKPRAKIAEVENAVHIEIPLRPKDFMAWLAWSLLTAFLLLAWSAPVAIAFQLTKASPQEKPPLLFTALFITVWLLIAVLLGMAWCQMTFGREIITVNTARVNLLAATVWATATLSACGGQKFSGAGRCFRYLRQPDAVLVVMALLSGRPCL
jgi:hypothetical protein